MAFDPVHPLLNEAPALRMLVLLAVLLLGATLWTYAGLAGASPWRLLILVSLRCLALLLALLALLRPSLSFSERNREQGVLYVAVDASESMGVADNKDGQSRWDALTRDLAASSLEFERLRRDANIETVFVRFGDGTTEFLPGQPGQPDLKRTDTGQMLRTLFERRGGRGRPVALFVLSDGADTGGPDGANEQARAWQRAACPVHTFAYGNPSAGERPRDVRIVSLTTEPLVPAGGELKVSVRVDAPGFMGYKVQLRLFVEDKERHRDREALSTVVTLSREADNVYELVVPAPVREGEYRVTVRADHPDQPDQPLPGEVNATNNRQSTYITVSREGLRVLLIDKRRGWEPQGIYDALAGERRLTIRTVWLGSTQPAAAGAADPFELDSQRPDVVILGDVSPAQVNAARADAVKRLAELVTDSEHPTGLIVLGGYAAFGNGDWPNTPLGKLFPCRNPVEKGQLEGNFHLEPKKAGLDEASYRSLLLLRDGAPDSKAAWDALRSLDGLSKLGEPDPKFEFVLAQASSGGKMVPVLVAGKAGGGRVLAFAGTTTYRWRSDAQGRDSHSRFWKQLVAWVANQQEPESTVRITPATRRLPVRRELRFGVQMFGKGGRRLEPVQTTMEVVDADGKTQARPTLTPSTPAELRGLFNGAAQPGEYRLKVTATANDPPGEGNARTVTGTSEVRFEIYDDDIEATRLGADHDALRDLAASGGGRFHAQPANDLPLALRELEGVAEAQDRRHVSPDWRSKDTSLFLMAYVALFALTLSSEWGLRRKWGLI